MQDCVLPGYKTFEWLAETLRLPETIHGADDSVASRADALLVLFMYLRTKDTLARLAVHPMLIDPGSNWSRPKITSIVKATMEAIDREHRARLTWSSFCFSVARAAIYEAAFTASCEAGRRLSFFSSGLSYLIDGTMRRIPRPVRGSNGEDRQRPF
jgi:hypothetical protein